MEKLRGDPGYKVVRVGWKARTAGFENTGCTETLLEKACSHFRLEDTEGQYALMVTMDGCELEASDDMLSHLSHMARITLQAVSEEEQGHSRILDQPLSCTRDAQMSCSNRGSHHTRCSSSRIKRTNSRKSTVASVQRVQQPATMTIFVKTFTGRTVNLEVALSETLSCVKDRIYESEGIPPDSQRLLYEGNRVDDERTVSDHGIEEKETLHLMLERRGGKPVIYLFPPLPLEQITVIVGLVPQWSFTHLYPVTDAKPLEDRKQQASWTVSAQPNDILTEADSGLELSYLFWEASSLQDRPPTPPLIPAGSPAHPNPDQLQTEHFDPSSPVLSPSAPSVVLLPFADLLPYLDRALKALTLHTAARNDFITYWLPKLARRLYVALRFLPQPAYERAAALSVSPAPDVVTRVFMLFRGVAESDVGDWEEARARAKDEDVDWVNVVGVRSEARDASLFRVLEWGAMEVF